MVFLVKVASIFVSILLCSNHEILCGAQKAAMGARRTVGRPVQPVQKTPAPGTKKEIFIAGHKQEDLEDATPDDVRAYARSKVKSTLIELYAKQHPLPTLAKHQEEELKSIPGRLKWCDSNTAVSSKLADLIAEERVDKLSPKEIEEYYKKIQENPRDYRYARHVFKKNFPAYSQALADTVKEGLYEKWKYEVRTELNGKSIEELRNHPLYKKHVASCKRDIKLGLHSSVSYILALQDELEQQVESELMSKFNKGSVEYYVEQGVMLNRLTNDVLKKMATEYTIKSDSPYILEAVKKAQNGALQWSPTIS